MLSGFKNLLKNKDQIKKEEAEHNFDDLMGKVQQDTEDLSQLETSIKEEWQEIKKDVDQVENGVDAVVNEK